MDLSMQVEERTFFKRIDWNFVLVILALNVVGLINLYSATHGPHSADVEPLFITLNGKSDCFGLYSQVTITYTSSSKQLRHCLSS